jgi:hypothetical protein
VSSILNVGTDSTGGAGLAPRTDAIIEPLVAVLRCHARVVPRARYVLDTLLLAAGIPVEYRDTIPASGPFFLYAQEPERSGDARARAMSVVHLPQAWSAFWGASHDVPEALSLAALEGAPLPLGGRHEWLSSDRDVPFDLLANAFFFLSSWHERARASPSSRQLHAGSEFARHGWPLDVVDRYLNSLVTRLNALAIRIGSRPWPPRAWPDGRNFAIVLSHDVDFLPVHFGDNARQAARTLGRHLLRERAPVDATRALGGYLTALVKRRDPYGCVPEILRREAAENVRSSFQVAVARRHPNDVNYDASTPKVRDYLRAITNAGFDLCLHGSFRSTERAEWYIEEAALIRRLFGPVAGSRQHFLAFDYDTLFAAQESAGIRYDMSIGYPDLVGPRAGFSYPFFPYCLAEDRPYNVVEIGLHLMDVTLRSYMRCSPRAAGRVIEQELGRIQRQRGCASVVWHPIVFGSARDPGYDDLYWRLVTSVKAAGGLATDGGSIDSFWRAEAMQYPTFSRLRATSLGA